MPKGKYVRSSPIDRFWSFVNKNGPTIRAGLGKCWVWTGGKIRGYGHFWLNGKTVKAYRHSYEVHVGKIPEGGHILHKCDNPSCVNPKHLFLGDYKSNRADCVAKGRQAKGESHGWSTKPERIPRGSRCGTAKLTEDDVKLIRKMRGQGVKPGKLARMFGVKYQNIWRIVTRVNWQHVT